MTDTKKQNKSSDIDQNIAQSKSYARLLDAAAGFKDRFALIMVRGSFFHLQDQWREKLEQDLKEKNIRLVNLFGDQWQREPGDSITRFIRRHAPDSGRWVLSLSRFDYHMMPTFPQQLKEKEAALLSETYQVQPSPSGFVQRLNLERDSFTREFPVPVILWASSAALRQIAEHAPDFFDFRQFIIDLPEPAESQYMVQIPGASYIKTIKPERLSNEAYRQFEAQLPRLRSRERSESEGRRLIGILHQLAAHNGAGGKWNDGERLLREGLDEALRLDIPEEQARLKEQIAFCLYRQGKPDQTLLMAREAIAIYRRLVQKSPNIYRPLLATILNWEAILLAEINKLVTAQKVFDETLAICRDLCREAPGVWSPLLAEVLNNYALLSAQLREFIKAEAYYTESIDVYRELFHPRHRVFLALVLNNYGNLMAAMNRLDRALPLHQEALHLRRLLVAGNPDYYRAPLGQSLFNLSLLLGEMGNYDEAQKYDEELRELKKHLSTDDLEVFGYSDHQAQPHGDVRMVGGNPYKHRSKLPPGSPMFFGRKREMERIMDLVSGQTPQGVSIVGERRIGKSSIAFRLFNQLKGKADTLAIYLDCDELPRDCDSAAAFYGLLNGRVKEAMESGGKAKAVGSRKGVLFSNYREFRVSVAEATKGGFRVVIFLDEFENLPEKEFADNTFFSNLRALADKPDYALAFVTVSRTDIKELTQQAIQSSGFYNIFERVPVGLLDQKSIKELRAIGFREGGFRLSGEERKKIDYYAGRFPFFNQVACAFLWDAKHYDETPDWDDLEVQLLPYYETLWKGRSRDEQVILSALNKKSSSDSFDMKILKTRGLVQKIDQLFYPFSDFFGLLMEKKRLEVRKIISGEKIMNYVDKGLGIAGKGIDVADKGKKLLK